MASRGAKPGVSASVATRAQRLVRALTGVVDARVDAAPNGRITGVYVVPEAGFSPHRVTQNVRSGLMAATGIVLEPGRVYIVRTLPEPESQTGTQGGIPASPGAPESFDEALIDCIDPERTELTPFARADHLSPDDDLLAPAPLDDDYDAPVPDTRAASAAQAAPAAPVMSSAPSAVGQPAPLRHGDDVPDSLVAARPDPLAPIAELAATAHQNDPIGSHAHAPPAQQPAWPVFNHYSAMPRIELLEMQRDENGAPRCRIVIESDGRRFLGTATNVRGSETTADLIAGAIVHALESLIPCDLHFDGMADVIIAGQRHVVVSLRNTSDWTHALSGAAPVHDSVEHAIATAILNAIGIGIAHTYSFMNRLVNHR